MLALIRINLIGRTGGGKKGGAKRGLQLPDVPNVGLLLFALFLVIEGAVFFQWQINASEEASRATSRLALRRKEIADLEKIKAEITATTEEVKKLDAQKLVFDVLLAERSGPVGALHYLSFMLQPRAEAETAADELKAMEAAGWRVAWDARKAWITGFRETDGEVTLTGEALGHEDVAEVQRRLESSAYFRDPKLVFQERKRDDRLGISFVEFSIRASLIYLIEPATPEVAAKEGEGAADAAGAEPSVGAAGGATPTQGSEMIGAKAVVPPTDALDAGAAPAIKGDASSDPSSGGDADVKDPDAKASDADADATTDADGDAGSKAERDAKAAAAPKEPEPDPAPKAAPAQEKALLPSAQPSAPPPPAEAADKLPAAE